MADCSGPTRFIPLECARYARCALALCLLAGGGAARADVLINEFLPDPEGSDAGREFVELLNPGSEPLSLLEVTLEFANGGAAVQWLVRWRGGPSDSLAAGARFLVVDRNWLGPPPGDAEVSLALQNGPDAIRLVRGGVVVDLVGYGSLTDPDFFAGEPVPVSPGRALARRPDGGQTANNRADFVSTAPTPGAPNFQPYSLAVLDLVVEPPLATRPGEAVRVAFTVRNDGTTALPAGHGRLVWPGDDIASWWDGAGPDEQRSLSFLIRPERRGILPLGWVVAVPGTLDTLHVDLGALQVGPSALRLNEVLPAPGQAQGEWVELQWTGEGPLDLAGFALGDADGGWIPLPAGIAQEGEFLVAAEDSAGLANWWLANLAAGDVPCAGHNGPPRLLRLAAWPSLNNSPPQSRPYADRVRLADPRGVVIDVVTWGGPAQELPGRDVSLERIGPEPVNPGATHWTLSTHPAGSTPGCPNSVVGSPLHPDDAHALQVVPPLLNREAGVTAVHLNFELSGAEASWEVGLFNLWGDLVRDFGGDNRGPGPRDLVWDGRDDRGTPVGPGVYVAWLQIRSEAGLIRRQGKSRLVVR